MRLITILLIAVAFTACTTRVEYEPVAHLPAAEAININTAAAAELERLPRVGKKTAEAIVRFRDEHGPFRRPEHLMQVRGISEKRFLTLRPLVRVD